MHATQNMMKPVTGAGDGNHSIEILRNAIKTHGGKCFLLVDPSLRALEDNPPKGAFFSHASSTTIPVAHTAFPPDNQPRLIELDISTEAGEALLAESVRVSMLDRQPESVARGQGQRTGGWLMGVESAQETADHWAKNLLQTDDQGRRCVLRFFDARVLALMWPVLAPAQRRGLLGPVQTWYALDACAKLTPYVAPGRSQMPMEITDEQWAAFHRHGIVNRALALFMNDVERQPRQEEVEAAVNCAGRAEQFGLWDHEDTIAFVRHALAWHPNFDAHPGMAPAFDKVSRGTLYSAAVSELDPRVVLDIQRGAWLKASQQPDIVPNDQLSFDLPAN